MDMKFIDLFAGIGGFHYGITKAFDEMEQRGCRQTEDKLEATSTNPVGQPDQRQLAYCVYANEWDKYANAVYRKHFGECDNRDIRTVDANGIPDFDLLCGGFPCQSFSIAGKRGGFSDTRGTLFFEIARILHTKRPRYLFLENVKGLLSHDAGNTFATIITALDELGYDCQWQVCNSKDFGVPQNRERIFIIGHLRGTRRPQVFPLGENGGLFETTDKPNTTPTQAKSSRTIRKSMYMMKSDDTFIKETKILGWSKSQRNWGVESRIKTNGEFNTLNTGVGGRSQSTANYIEENAKIRRLIPIECERLQGFPDNWTQYGVDGELISDTQRYKMCGNAVTTNVITAIIKELFKD